MSAALAGACAIPCTRFFEERDLIAQFGAQYQAYRARTGMLLPRWGGAKRAVPELKH